MEENKFINESNNEFSKELSNKKRRARTDFSNRDYKCSCGK